MISADGIHRELPLCKPGKKPVKKLHCLRRRNRSVIKITGEKDPIRCFFINDPQDFIQNIFLIFDHGKLIDTFS